MRHDLERSVANHVADLNDKWVTSGFRQVLPLPPQPETITTCTDDKPLPDTSRVDALSTKLQGTDIHYWWHSYESLARDLARELEQHRRALNAAGEAIEHLESLVEGTANSAIEPIKCRTCRSSLVQATVDKCDSGEACPFYRYRSTDRGGDHAA